MSRKVISSLPQWYDKRPQRERIVLLICVIIVLIFLVNLLVLQPLFQQQKSSRSELRALQTSTVGLENRRMEINLRQQNDPDKEQRKRLEVLTEESEKLHQVLKTNIVNLVSPGEMPELLKDLLTRQKKLQLISLENLPAELVALDGDNGAGAVLPTLYRHRLRMEFSGDYLTLLKYLRQLEQLPRSLVWDEVAIETGKYPQATVRLQVYTLSLTEGWIGG